MPPIFLAMELAQTALFLGTDGTSPWAVSPRALDLPPRARARSLRSHARGPGAAFHLAAGLASDRQLGRAGRHRSQSDAASGAAPAAGRGKLRAHGTCEQC